MDISTIPNTADLEDEGSVLELNDAAGNPWLDNGKPVTALVAGAYSRRAANARTAALGRGLKIKGKATAEHIDASQLKVDAAYVIRWDITDGDKMARPEEVFVSHPFIREQIVERANEHARFFKKASPS